MKTVLITGGTNGIGLSALKALDEKLYFPILICRSEEKAQQTLAELGRGRYYICDLGNLTELKKVCNQVLENETQIDFFVGNAGVIGFDKETYSDLGVEMTIQTNFLSHFLICETLSPLFEQSKTTLIFTSSVMHRSRHHANYDFSKEINTPSYSPFKAYARSKACLVSYADYLANLRPEIHVYLADPGVVGSGIMRSRGKLMNLLFALAKPLFSSTEKGAKPIIHCITQIPNGKSFPIYYKGTKEVGFNKRAKDKEGQLQLVSHALKLIKMI